MLTANGRHFGMRLIMIHRFLTIFLLAASLSAPLAAQTDPPQGTAAVDSSLLAGLKSRVEQSQLSDEQKASLLGTITQSETHLKDAASLADATQKRVTATDSVADRAKETTEQFEQLKSFEVEKPVGKPLAELDPMLVDLEARLATTKTAVTDAATSLARSTQTRLQYEAELVELDKQLAERKTQVAATTANSEMSLEDEVKLAELMASQAFISARIDSLRSQIALMDAETASGLPQMTSDLLDRQAETLELQLAAVKAAVESERALDAAQRVEAAQAQLTTLHRALRPIGQQNQELANDSQVIATNIETTEVSLATRTAELERIRNAYEKAITRVDSVGLTDAVGALLRNLKQSLPRAGVLRLRSRERQPTINEAQFDLIDLTDRRNLKMSIAVDALLSAADPPISFAERRTLEEEARELIQQQRTEFLDPAIRNQTTYFNTLVSLSTTEQQIIDLVDEATLYVNKRILWIRSSKPLTTQFAPSRDEWWFLSPSAWNNLASKIGDELKSNFALWGLLLIGIIAVIRSRSRLRRHVRGIGDVVTKANYTDFTATLKALLLAVLTAAPLPLFLWFFGWRLGNVAGTDQMTLALAHFATTFAIGYFPAELVRQVCRPSGLAVFHFEFPPDGVAMLRRAGGWAEAITIPILAVSSFLSVSSWGFGRDVLERYFFVAAMASLVWMVARLLHPHNGLPGNYLRRNPNGWAKHLTIVWYPLAVGTPIALGVLAVIGYFFTAQQLGWQLFQSVGLLLLIGLAISVVLRWVLLHRRKLRIDEMRLRREAEVPDKVAEVPIAPTATTDELQAQMRQTRRLLQTVMLAFALIGLWLIWQDVTPALDFLEKWPIWTSTETITETISGEDGKKTTETRDVQDKVTIDELVLAILIIVVTVAAVRNIPGLLEFSLLRRLPLDHSTRYAITSLTSYAIVLVGLIIACRKIGLHWNQIQWMATALTFGLAFGLQEMFANFVAGIIILFEQPVRVGDVVEIDGVTGVVTKIRIRATTITNWDRKDYIVPNKEFITGKLLNWTRSDEVSRVTIGVGIAYGSDTYRAQQLLMQTATNHPDVLQDPRPTAIFEGFGDSSLNFMLRAHINSYQNRLKVIHELHTAIDDAFRGAEIEISFPQRDLHLRTLPEEVNSAITSASKNTSGEQNADDSAPS